MNLRLVCNTASYARIFAACILGILAAGCSANHVAPKPPLPPPVRTPIPRANRTFEEETWRPATPAEYKSAQQIVQMQLRAFRDRNYQKAIDLETSRFAAGFSTPSKLRDLIEKSYPAFNRLRSIQWRHAFTHKKDKSMRISFRFNTTRNGTVGAIYLLKLEKNGYRIDGISTRIIASESNNLKPWPFKPTF